MNRFACPFLLDFYPDADVVIIKNLFFVMIVPYKNCASKTFLFETKKSAFQLLKFSFFLNSLDSSLNFFLDEGVRFF